MANEADRATGLEVGGDHDSLDVSGSVSRGAVEHDVFAPQSGLEEEAEVMRIVIKPALVSNVHHTRKCMLLIRQVVTTYGRAVHHL